VLKSTCKIGYALKCIDLHVQGGGCLRRYVRIGPCYPASEETEHAQQEDKQPQHDPGFGVIVHGSPLVEMAGQTLGNPRLCEFRLPGCRRSLSFSIHLADVAPTWITTGSAESTTAAARAATPQYGRAGHLDKASPARSNCIPSIPSS
jgi:hypothetical protein